MKGEPKMKKLTLAGLLFLLTSCGDYTNIKSPFSSQEATSDGPMAVSTQLDFATIKREILQAQCISCHTGKHRNYADYGVVAVAAPQMLQLMTSADPQERMPPNAPRLPDAQIAMFREWVQAGAPKNFSEDKSEDTDSAQGETAKVGFAQVKKQILDAYQCTSCHVQYRTYEFAYRDSLAILSSVDSDSMPFPRRKNLQVEPVSPVDKALLTAWVSQGAPEFPGVTVNEVPLPPIQPTYISLRNHVFGPKCILCHNSYGNRGFGKSLDTFRNLWTWMQEVPHLIKLNKEEGEEPGLLVEAIQRDPENPFLLFSPMPFNTNFDDVEDTIPRVTDQELQMIQEWIRLQLPYDEGDL
jgi:mono/diheme cytochrome c family protein